MAYFQIEANLPKYYSPYAVKGMYDNLVGANMTKVQLHLLECQEQAHIQCASVIDHDLREYVSLTLA